MPDSTPDATKRERTVGDIMSHPVVTARPAETRRRRRGPHARAQGRLGRRHRRRRPRDRHPHRTRHDPPRGRRLRRVDREGVGVDDRGPDTVAPDVEARAAFASLSEHGYRHIPVVDDDAARRHRVDARPHAHRDDPARRGPGARGAEGPRRRRRRRHDRRRRPRPRGLLPLPPVQRGRPRARRGRSKTSGT